ncbi:MerR family transcriptional regulator [Nocardia bovistercoris]|uniref:MerR family transcriptional regulator n=1 Tax=Nocardia bovistercoris TaxID=2785916 RepID=A0A931N4V7_9NOCA|nr:MerR family transcriptional regulator [Nocardia bovistercoris]MBH0779107.1 MerR family transcriptional regulator [Nocardia bovistercoris]
MTATVSIGEFSRLTYLTVKTLRHYHEIALLVPVEIDVGSGYRRYSTDQVADAHLIRRLRRLDMPLPEIKAVLDAPDLGARDATLRAHLERMEEQLQRTREVVTSLRALLTPAAPVTVEYRTSAAFPALGLRAVIDRADTGAWCESTFGQLYGALAAAGIEPAGPGGATYSLDFFEHDLGEVLAYVPLPEDTEIPDLARDGLARVELPARRFAVAMHLGPFEDFDRTYGALGTHVAEHDVSLLEPVREIYLTSPDDTDNPADYITEVCWPIAHQ